MSELDKVKSIYFIGIGGSGMSSLAAMMLAQKKNVVGSEKELNAITEALSSRGAVVFTEQSGEHVPDDVDLVVYTVAIPESNGDLKRARQLGVPVLSYPEMLGLISKNMVTIAVSGTHGKTTTTAMLAHVLEGTAIAPTVLMGSAIADHKINFIEGAGKYLLVEACEYRKSFLNLSPTYLIITNVDEDHLDFYKDLSDIQRAFKDLVTKIPEDGFVVCDAKNPHLLPVVDGVACAVVDYAGVLPENTKLLVPGNHNRENAAAVFALASKLGIDSKIITEKLETFKGVKRRFEFRGKTAQGAFVYDDYAHNPQKVAAALQGAREVYPNSKIIAVFQPHLYSRTKTLLKAFGQSFGDADTVLIAPIYAAREPFDPSVSAEILASEIRANGASAEAFDSIDNIKGRLDQTLSEGDVLMVLGAGDIIRLSDSLL
ncbi:MAG: UDP-N-acetylmuramate--L-alanine ligase [bacterium]